MQMPAEMLAAIKAHFAMPERAWRVTAAMEEAHTQTSVSDVGGVPTTTESVVRSASVTVESAVMGRAIVFMLEGDEESWHSGRAIFDGVSFDFDDGPLLTHLGNAITALGPVASEAIMTSYFGPVPMPEQEG